MLSKITLTVVGFHFRIASTTYTTPAVLFRRIKLESNSSGDSHIFQYGPDYTLSTFSLTLWIQLGQAPTHI